MKRKDTFYRDKTEEMMNNVGGTRLRSHRLPAGELIEWWAVGRGIVIAHYYAENHGVTFYPQELGETWEESQENIDKLNQ